MNKYFNVSLNRPIKSDMNNYNYNFTVDSIPVPTLTYFPLRNTSVNPVYGNNGNDNQTINGQTYTFVPNDGLYFDSPPTQFYNLFRSTNINDPDIRLWNVSNITHMAYMFQFARDFNQDISNWDVSNVISMAYMFYGASRFNQDIGGWNVSNVNNMSNMFRDAVWFNQDLSGWCVSNISSEPQNFSWGSALDPANKPIWGTCP